MLLLLGLGSAGCAASPPSVSPGPATPPPPLPGRPWLARRSVAEGAELPRAKVPPTLIRGATLLLGTGRAVAAGSILLVDGRIAAVGDRELTAPEGAQVIDGRGKFVTPGLIDTHSHLGVYPLIDVAAHHDGNEMTEPITAHVQAVDAFWPEDPGLPRALAGGVTTIQVLPGSGNLIGGRAVTVKLRPGRSGREMHFPGAPDGLKMACGENPKRVYGREQRKAPMTRMGNLALQRSAFLRADKLRRDWSRFLDGEQRRLADLGERRARFAAQTKERALREAWCREQGEPTACVQLRKEWLTPLLDPDAATPATPERDPGLETLAGALDGGVLVHVHCYRADDMLAMLALADEVGFKVRSFHHALEAYKLRDVLAARGIAASTWADWWGFKLEAWDGIPENAGLLAAAGGKAIIHSDSAEGIQRLNQEAAKALANGRRAGLPLDENEAIRWVTANPAWALGVDDRVGTLEVGKDADVVLWDRSPLSVYASAEKVWIDGLLLHDRGAQRRTDFELGGQP